MLNTRNITLRLDKIEQNLAMLSALAVLPFSEFEKDPRNYQAAQHLLQTSIESCLDIGSHIISAIGARRPQDYKDVFVVMGEEKILSEKFSKKLVPMARFRNRLVHLYFDVDIDEVYRILQENLGDFSEFSQQIVKFIKRYVVDNKN